MIEDYSYYTTPEVEALECAAEEQKAKSHSKKWNAIYNSINTAGLLGYAAIHEFVDKGSLDETIPATAGGILGIAYVAYQWRQKIIHDKRAGQLNDLAFDVWRADD